MKEVSKLTRGKRLIVFNILLLVLLFITDAPLYALTDVTGFTEIISSGYSKQNNAVVMDNNDIYLLYNNNKLIKYTYSTGTWGSSQTVKVGGSNKEGSTFSHFIQKDGVFHMLYASDTDYGDAELYYTYSTDPYNFPTATYLGAVQNNLNESAVINVRSDGKVAIFFGGRSSRCAYVYSNYGGSFVKYELGLYGSDMTYCGVCFDNDNHITAYREYSPYDGGSYEGRHYTDTYTWNGSSWAGPPSTTYSKDGPDWQYMFPYAKYIWEPDDAWAGSYHYLPIHAERVGSVVLRSSYGSYSYNYLKLDCANFRYDITRTSSQDRASLVKKFNAPDGRIIWFRQPASGKISVMFADYFTPQPISATGNTTNSIRVTHTQGDNPNFITTWIRVSASSDMETIIESISVANSGTKTTIYNTTVSALQPSTRYFLRSEVVDGFGRVKYAPIITRSTLPVAPDNLNFSNLSSSSMTITYNSNGNGPGTKYSIERSLSGNPEGSDWEEIYCGTDLIFDDSELSPQTNYFYRVRALNQDNEWGDYTVIKGVQTLERDRVAPTIALIINKGAGILSSDLLPVNSVIGDNRTSNSLLKYSYSINGGTWSELTLLGNSTGILNILIPHKLDTSGDLNFQLRVYDEDGNVGIANARVYYQKPAELPEVPSGETVRSGGAASLAIGTLDTYDVYFTSRSALYLNMSTQTQPSYQVKINNAPYGDITPKEKEAIIHLGTEGLHVLTIRQVNSMGIPGAGKEYKIVIDKTAPNVTVAFTDGRTITSSETVNARISGNDNISTMLKYRVNDAGWKEVPFDGIITLPLAQGFNNLQVDVGDDAGLYSSHFLKIWRHSQ